MVEGARTMANHISPAAQLFRGMAELIDHDYTSRTQYDAITKAAAALAVLPREVGAGPAGLSGVDLNEDLRVWCGAATHPRRPRRSSWLTVTHP